MPSIYRGRLRLLENTFFSSREVSNLYQTEAFIGHIALCYALGLAPSRYRNDKTIHYAEDLRALNERGIYLTPASIDIPALFVLGQFNAQPETFWSAMGNNALVVAGSGMWAEKDGANWYLTDGTQRRKYGVENRPQFGRIRALAIGNMATFYIISDQPLELPSYLRLGKWMSKASLEVQAMPVRAERERAMLAPHQLFAPSDFAAAVSFMPFNVINVAPSPLAHTIEYVGACYELGDGTCLPQGMRFAL